MPLIECVPNFSEGRDAAVVEAIVMAMLAVPGVYLLGREMDPDHHRSVITVAGEAAAVAEAAVRGVGVAVERIDLRQHRGAHPRLGAADVVPFVPLEGATLAECVHWAEWAGAEIWRRFQVPVYLYAAAARRPERRPLEAVRRGQFEGLSEQVRRDPEKLPDFGPPSEQAALHPSAGATIVGARPFLIAYNINLETQDVEVARAIARTIRASGGGLPAVKAMGVRLSASARAPARTQVSMNLTDYTETSLATVWRAVNTEAAKRGVDVTESELVGLLPRAALEEAGAELLQLKQFDSRRVVENCLQAVVPPSGNVPGAPPQSPVDLVLAAVGSVAPLPNGGVVAALAAALAAALGANAALRSGAADAAADLEQLELACARTAARDRSALLAPPRQEPASTATVRAAEIHLQLAAQGLQLAQLLAHLRLHAPAALAGDLATAGTLAVAAVRAARLCITATLRTLPAGADRQRLAAACASLPETPLFP